MTREERKDFQRTLNAFANQWLYKMTPLIVDGDFGHATNTRVRTVKFYLGWDEERIVKEGDSYRTDVEDRREIVRRARHPMTAEHFPSEYVMYRGRRRRRRRRLRIKATEALAYLTPGVTSWEGKTVAKCAVPYLNYARAHGWTGGVTSGWRDPWYSRQLCRNMCGHDTCPGKCAGLTSNHVGNYCGRFAIDVSDYVRFGRIMADMPLDKCPNRHRIFNDLPVDPVHFSPSGH